MRAARRPVRLADMPADPEPDRRRPTWRRVVEIGALGLVALLLVIQLVPYGRDHTNPTPTKQVTLATAAQRELFRSACQDCHSDQTDWLWYTSIAPVSWSPSPTS